MVPRLAGVFMLGAAQGVLGWYMVRSGLVDEPRVSQYRLAAHLSLAVVIYVWLLVLGLRAFDVGASGRRGGAGDADSRGRGDHAVDTGDTDVPGRRGDAGDTGARGRCDHAVVAGVSGRHGDADASGAQGRRSDAGAARWLVLAAGVTVFATLVMGAFVAGLKAGHVYPTFPKMGGFWAPPGMFEASPWWRNFFENPVTVQFTHRAFALASGLVVVAAWATCLGAGVGASRRVRLWAGASLAAVVVQIVLGVSTVLLHVPIPLAAGHQAGAIALLTCLVGLYHAASAPRLALSR